MLEEKELNNSIWEKVGEYTNQFDRYISFLENQRNQVSDLLDK